MKVPAEFIVQHNENANPPTFFVTMETLLLRMEAEGQVDMAFLSHIYPRLQVWFSWFNTTQVGTRTCPTVGGGYKVISFQGGVPCFSMFYVVRGTTFDLSVARQERYN